MALLGIDIFPIISYMNSLQDFYVPSWFPCHCPFLRPGRTDDIQVTWDISVVPETCQVLEDYPSRLQICIECILGPVS